MITPHRINQKYGPVLLGLPVGLTSGILWWREVHGIGGERSLRFFLVMLVWAVGGCIWAILFGRIWKWLFPKLDE